VTKTVEGVPKREILREASDWGADVAGDEEESSGQRRAQAHSTEFRECR
jgi:hypothetical protein